MFGLNPLLFQNSICCSTVVTCAIMGWLIYRWDTGTERFHNLMMVMMKMTTMGGGKFGLIYLDLAAPLTSLFKWIKAFCIFISFFLLFLKVHFKELGSRRRAERRRVAPGLPARDAERLLHFPTTTFIWISKNQRKQINMHAENIPPATFRINVGFF